MIFCDLQWPLNEIFAIHINVLGRIFLNSGKERHKDGVFLWDVEELTFLISYRSENFWKAACQKKYPALKSLFKKKNLKTIFVAYLTI